MRAYKTRTKAGSSRLAVSSKLSKTWFNRVTRLRESATSRVATLCARKVNSLRGVNGNDSRLMNVDHISTRFAVCRTRLMERRVQFFFPPPFGVGATDRRVSTVIAKRPRGQECR